MEETNLIFKLAFMTPSISWVYNLCVKILYTCITGSIGNAMLQLVKHSMEFGVVECSAHEGNRIPRQLLGEATVTNFHYYTS